MSFKNPNKLKKKKNMIRQVPKQSKSTTQNITVKNSNEKS